MSTPGSSLPPIGPWGAAPTGNPGSTEPTSGGLGGSFPTLQPAVPQPSAPAPAPGISTTASPSPFPAPVATAATGDLWGGTTSSSVRAFTTVTAPTGLLYGSLAASIGGLVLAGLFEEISISVLAWALAALVGLGLTAVFLVRNARRQAAPGYLSNSWHNWLYRAAVVVALLAVVAAAARIALYVGRM
ncbi:Uncharacterised protein [Actinomyces bovis]|uniref:Uncharacterized protein n=1 Tax=Actinomyces bovis TaxID=1658 RepID=A0ABY1VM93_9ACTO|nr:hypothetical protein [Actinomyces bovis]SPT52943.1 Uncharacterised protein [Actinomyces bovis]VEG55125.1 Uncharacterised protein [Actinomyces israelii]